MSQSDFDGPDFDGPDAPGRRFFSAEGAEKDARIVREGFWNKLRRVVRRIPFAPDLLAAYYCASDPATPFKVRATLYAALAYFVVPSDMLPDIVAVLGFTDDAAVLMAAIGVVSTSIKDEHRRKAAAALADELVAS